MRPDTLDRQTRITTHCMQRCHPGGAGANSEIPAPPKRNRDDFLGLRVYNSAYHAFM